MLRLMARFQKEDHYDRPHEIVMIIYGKSLLDIRNQGHKFISDYNKQAEKRGNGILKKEVFFGDPTEGNGFD